MYIDIAPGVSIYRDPEHMKMSREEIIENLTNSLSNLNPLILSLWKSLTLPRDCNFYY